MIKIPFNNIWLYINLWVIIYVYHKINSFLLTFQFGLVSFFVAFFVSYLCKMFKFDLISFFALNPNCLLSPPSEWVWIFKSYFLKHLRAVIWVRFQWGLEFLKEFLGFSTISVLFPASLGHFPMGFILSAFLVLKKLLVLIPWNSIGDL